MAAGAREALRLGGREGLHGVAPGGGTGVRREAGERKGGGRGAAGREVGTGAAARRVWLRRTKLLKAAGVPQGLTLAELTKPDLRVVRRNLSALINFHKFRDERLAVYQEHSQEHRRLEEERAAADRAGEELERRLAELTARRAAERPGEERVRQECMSLTAEIEALNTQQAQLRALTTQHKASLLASRDKVSSLQFEVLTAREEADAVARAVVPNVEEVKEEVLRAEAAADEERAAGHEAERRLRDIKVRLDLVGRCEADVETSRTLVLEAGAELAKVDDAQAQLRSALAEAESAKAARAEAATAEEHARKALVRLEDRLAALRRSEEDKRSKGEMELRADKAELERVRLEIDALRSAKDAGDERIRSEHALDAADEKKHLAAMGEMQLEYDRLCAALATYHKKLFEHAARANGL